MTEKRQRNGPTGTVRTPRCELEFPPAPSSTLRTRFIAEEYVTLRTRFMTQDHVIYDVCDDCVTPSLVMANAIYHARLESAAASPLRVAPPPTTAPIPAAEILASPPDALALVALRDNPHLLPNVGAESLEDVLRYCYFHTSKQKEKMPQSQVQQWDDRYVRVDPRRLCELASAAYYLDIRDLVDLTCRAIAAIISGKTAEQIRTTFNIENDLVQSLTGMIQLDDQTIPSSRRASPSSRGRRQGRHDQLDKSQPKKQSKPYSLSAIDDFGNGDAEERRDAPQLGTHSIDEVEKWINGPDPAKGNGKRRKKKKKHKSSAVQSEPHPPDPVPPPPPSSSLPPRISSPPPSPSSSSVPDPSPNLSRDPSYCPSSSTSSPSSQLKSRAEPPNGVENVRQVEQQATNGLHEEPASNTAPEVIILSSDDDDVVPVSEEKVIPFNREEQVASDKIKQDVKEFSVAVDARVNSEGDVAIKLEGARNQNVSPVIRRAEKNTKMEVEREEVEPSRSPSHQEEKAPPSAGKTSGTLMMKQRKEKEIPVDRTRFCRSGDDHAGKNTPATQIQIKTEPDVNGSTSGAAEIRTLPTTGIARKEADFNGVVENRSRNPRSSPAERVPNGGTTAAHLEDAGPSYIRCSDRMDKEVEDFANRLNCGIATSAIEAGVGDSKDSVLRGAERHVRDRGSEPPHVLRNQHVSNGGQSSIAEAQPGASNSHYDAGMRLMENKLEQARKEAQLQERKRHYEERASDIERQIATLISEREKVRDELTYVKMELVQLNTERPS